MHSWEGDAQDTTPAYAVHTVMRSELYSQLVCTGHVAAVEVDRRLGQQRGVVLPPMVLLPCCCLKRPQGGLGVVLQATGKRHTQIGSWHTQQLLRLHQHQAAGMHGLMQQLSCCTTPPIPTEAAMYCAVVLAQLLWGPKPPRWSGV